MLKKEVIFIREKDIEILELIKNNISSLSDDVMYDDMAPYFVCGLRKANCNIEYFTDSLKVYDKHC